MQYANTRGSFLRPLHTSESTRDFDQHDDPIADLAAQQVGDSRTWGRQGRALGRSEGDTGVCHRETCDDSEPARQRAVFEQGRRARMAAAAAAAERRRREADE
jgi:hypothetical protein